MHTELQIFIDLEIIDKIAFLKFYNKESKLNLINSHFISELKLALVELQELHKNELIKGIVFTSAEENGFIAGIDYHLLSRDYQSNTLKEKITEVQQLFTNIRNLPVPVVAAINGMCIGGGLEFALTCQYRIASNDTKNIFMLPEVRLGIIPSFGGCVRLSKLIELRKALDFICRSRICIPEDAMKLGIIDEVVPSEILLQTAIKAINNWRQIVENRKAALQSQFSGSLVKKFLRTKIGITLLQWISKRKIIKQSNGNFPAPLKALDVIVKASYLNNSDALNLEKETVSELLLDPPPKSPAKFIVDTLIMKDELKAIARELTNPEIQSQLPVKIAIIGANELTSELVNLLIMNNIRVRLTEYDQKELSKTLRKTYYLLQETRKNKRITNADFVKKYSLINPSPNISGISDVNFVFVNLFGNLESAKNTLLEIEQLTSENSVVAVNSINLSLEELANVVERPENLIRLNLFLPTSQSQIIEIDYLSEITSSETIDKTIKLLLKLRKIPLVIENKTGFLLNRIMISMLNEVFWLILEGVAPIFIDDAMTKFGMHFRPCELIDEIGIDSYIQQIWELSKHTSDRYISCGLAARMQEKKWLGKNNKLGLYTHTEQPKVKVKKNRNLSKISRNHRLGLVMTRKKAKYTPDEILKRLICVMVNESSFALEDEVISDARTLDAALIHSNIFPGFKGGLLKFADSMGIADIVKYLDTLRISPPEYSSIYSKQPEEFRLLKSQDNGRRFVVCSKLRGLADSDETFYPRTKSDKPDDVETTAEIKIENQASTSESKSTIETPDETSTVETNSQIQSDEQTTNAEDVNENSIALKTSPEQETETLETTVDFKSDPVATIENQNEKAENEDDLSNNLPESETSEENVSEDITKNIETTPGDNQNCDEIETESDDENTSELEENTDKTPIIKEDSDYYNTTFQDEQDIDPQTDENN